VSAETDAPARTLPARHPAPRAPEDAADVEWLIDNADAYRAIVDAIRGARRSIRISQLALDADCVAYDAGGGQDESTPLVGELVAACRRGVQVRVLLNASLLLDTVAPLRRHLASVEAGAGRIRVRGVSRFPQLLHAKMVVVDDDLAFLVGSPFANGYWDDSRHEPVDARRPHRELGGRPVHDVSISLGGSAARSLGAAFVELWNDAQDVSPDDRERLVAPVTLPARSSSSVRIVRTAPGDGPMQILPALLDGIARARSLIYVEHQYLSARPVVEALALALRRHRGLELIVVLNQNPDVTAYRGWQNTRMREAGLLDHPRVGIFSLWSAAAGRADGRRLNQVFVHSKVVAIDDRWASVGSANLDGVSLHSYGDDFSSRLGRRVFRGVRNFDVNVVVDGTEDDAAGELVHGLRDRLWQEHLGPSYDADGGRPTHGWLPLWRSLARRNAEALGCPGPTCLERPFVLPYSTCSAPRAQLADVGVLFAPGAIELCFEPSWLEVHFSPNWVRNMFG
jgi:phosphatidylserine/phosphatidylglycerophosphate/cardiolipin synthase-like enzyme